METTQKNEIPLYLSTGAFTGRANGRDPHLLTRFFRALDCDGFEWMLMQDHIPAQDELIAEYRGAGVVIPVVHTRKELGDLLSTPGDAALHRAEAMFTEDCGIARRVGARRAVIHGWGLPDSDAVFPRTLFRIARLAEIARREGVELLAENCVCACGSPLAHLRELAEALPDIGLLVDTRCSEFHAELPATMASPLWEGAVRHVHINDYRGGFKDWEHRYPIYQPWDGQIDWDGFFAALRRHRWRGTVTLEASAMLPDRVDVETLNRSLRRLRERLHSVTEDEPK